MKYKSEAQAFQAIRKEYKRRRNEAQRQQNHYDWSAKHGGQRHPYLLKMVSKIMKKTIDELPRITEESARYYTARYQDNVSECQLFLNRFRT